MLQAFAAAAAAIATLSVPYVPQTDALCGGAAAAMVFRYWGDAHAGVDQFTTLVERRSGGPDGIAAGVLADAVVSRGWRVEHADPSLDGLRARVAAKQPVIVLLGDRRDQYHYVVVVGAAANGVVVHDPSWGPSRTMPDHKFDALWAASGRWSLVVLPSSGPAISSSAPVVESAEKTGARTPTACDAMLAEAVDAVRSAGLDRADALLVPVQSRCPQDPGAFRELAGVRFAQKRWADAAALARQALERDASDAYASEVLGSSLFMLNEPVAALRAWNTIGKPRLDLVTIEGVRHSRHQAINEALRLRPNTLLTASAFEQAAHRLEDLPDRANARLEMRPEPDGFTTVRVAITERAGFPRSIPAWTGAAARAAIDREASLVLPGFTGQGEIWSASWRWWTNRPRVALSFAAPRVGGLFGVWRVEGSWEAETYRSGFEIRRQARKHASLTVSDWMSGSIRYSLAAGADFWDGGRRAASIGGTLERRWFDDRLSLSGDVTSWMPVDGGTSFAAAGSHLSARSRPRPSGWVYEASTGFARVTDSSPLALWPGAGEGRARPELARAHPLLDDGIIDMDRGNLFGRTIQFATAEAQRWFQSRPLSRVGVATFIDVARTGRRLTPGTIIQTDVGAGVRLKVPGTSKVVAIDFARGVRDGATALTVHFDARP